jgi:hypothetical protein
VHARDAAQLELPTLLRREQRERGGQRSHRGAGVAQEQVGRLDRQGTCQAAHAHAVAAKALDAAAQSLERGQHHAGVVGVEQVVDVGLARAQGRQQQHAVGDALGAGQGHAAAGAAQRRQVEEMGRVHGGQAATASEGL